MPYCVGVIGCGRWGMKHISTLLEMKKQGRINQVFACDINPKRLESLPQSVDGKFSSWREMCKQISFDLVTIATPNPTHYRLGREIMSMGTHVLIEKPTATSSSEVAKLSQIAAQYSSNLHSGYLLRYHPVVLEAEKKIRRGDIGAVKSIRYVKYSSRNRSAGSNIVSGLASHAFDTVPYLANLRLNPLVLSAVAFSHDELAPLDKASKGNIRLQYKDVQRASNIEVEVTVGWGLDSQFSVTIEGTKKLLFLDLQGDGNLRLDSLNNPPLPLLASNKKSPLESQYQNILSNSELAQSAKKSLLTTAQLIDSAASWMKNWYTQYA